MAICIERFPKTKLVFLPSDVFRFRILYTCIRRVCEYTTIYMRIQIGVSRDERYNDMYKRASAALRRAGVCCRCAARESLEM